jgi:hypothetical protein
MAIESEVSTPLVPRPTIGYDPQPVVSSSFTFKDSLKLRPPNFTSIFQVPLPRLFPSKIISPLPHPSYKSGVPCLHFVLLTSADQHNTRNFSLRNSLRYSLTLSFLGPNMLLSNLFSNNCNLCSSPK